MGCVEYLFIISWDQLKIKVNFLFMDIHNLYGVQLGKNVIVAFLQELFHMARENNSRGVLTSQVYICDILGEANV